MESVAAVAFRGSIQDMSETPERAVQPTPVDTAPPPPPARVKPPKLYAAAAWVVIVAGIVFIVSVVFFSGAMIFGYHHHHCHHHHGMMFAPGGPGPGPGGPARRSGPVPGAARCWPTRRGWPGLAVRAGILLVSVMGGEDCSQ
jgi:hypothetical protein